MNEAVLVHEIQALEDLRRDLPGLDFGERTPEVLFEVAVFEVLHRDED